jgi:hypothetical protein
MVRRTNSEESEDWRIKKLLKDIATLGPTWRDAVFLDICNKDAHCYGTPGSATRKKIQRVLSYLSERSDPNFERYYQQYLSDEEIIDFKRSYNSGGKGYLAILL